MTNQAAELGPRQFSWWPDWRGECCAIVASGPSLKRTDVDSLKGRIHVIAIKESVELCPWAEVVYGCDAAWWIHRKGLPEFKGVKIAHGPQATGQYPSLRKVSIDMRSDGMLVKTPMTVGCGGNSGHQALNLAIQFGATDIILLAYDCGADPHHLHWYGRNKWLNANNPLGTNFARWRKGFEHAAKDAGRLGVTVVNVSPNSTIGCFKKVGLEAIMAEWGL